MPQSPSLGPASGNFRGWFGGSRYDYTQEAGELWSNSVVSICINRKATMMADCRLIIQKYNEAKGKWEPAQGPAVKQALAIFRKPNEYYNFTALINAIALSADCRGQYFLYIRRDNAGRPIGFWYLPHTWVNVQSNQNNTDGTQLVTNYRYTIPGGGQVYLPIEDVLMVRNGIDPKDTRCGLSPLYGQLREISSDNEASNWLASLLRNGATPSVFMTPKVAPATGQSPTIAQMRENRDIVNESIRDARGQAVMMPFPMELTPAMFNPKDMELGKIRAIPTDRICAALGGDPMAFGLPSESKTYSNLEEALDALGNLTVLPTMRDWAAQWSEKMLPAFGMDPEMYRYAWDTSDVSWLADDTAKRNENVRANFESGIIDRFRAKEEIGETPDTADKGVTYFMLQASAQPMPEPAPPKKQGISNWAVKMGAANTARLQNLGRTPGATLHKVNLDKAAQTAHNRNINAMDRKWMAAMERYKSGTITADELQGVLSDLIYNTHRKQYELGWTTGGNEPTAAQLDAFARTVTDTQQEYLANFIQDITDGRYTDADGTLDLDGALAQRSRMYAANTSASASAGFIEGSPEDEEFIWRLGPVEHCEDCLYIQTLSPFDKSTIFTNPREGETQCLSNCKCQWIRQSDGLAPFGPID
jgi:HK97 family phage portal protein